MIDVLGIALLVALVCGLAWDLYQLGKRNGYHQGQCDAAVDFRRGYQRACADVIREVEEEAAG